MALENKLGLTDSAALAREEERLSKKKAAWLFESGTLDALEPGTSASLEEIHRILFEDIYDFKNFRFNLIRHGFAVPPSPPRGRLNSVPAACTFIRGVATPVCGLVRNDATLFYSSKFLFTYPTPRKEFYEKTSDFTAFIRISPHRLRFVCGGAVLCY